MREGGHGRVMSCFDEELFVRASLPPSLPLPPSASAEPLDRHDKQMCHTNKSISTTCASGEWAEGFWQVKCEVFSVGERGGLRDLLLRTKHTNTSSSNIVLTVRRHSSFPHISISLNSCQADVKGEMQKQIVQGREGGGQMGMGHRVRIHPPQ